MPQAPKLPLECCAVSMHFVHKETEAYLLGPCYSLDLEHCSKTCVEYVVLNP